jgi:hypothetical protein
MQAGIVRRSAPSAPRRLSLRLSDE